MHRSTRTNIWCLYLIKASKWFKLFMPYVVPFYLDNNLNMQEIMLLQAVYSVSIVAMEIPSGYLADVIGRRRTLILGAMLGCIGFIVYSFSFRFAGFLVAELVLGVGQSFVSGADSALLYDSLMDRNKQKEYIKYEGRTASIGNVAEAGAGIAGGFLALISLRMNFYVQTGVAFLAIPAAFMLVEPPRYGKAVSFTFKKILAVVKDTLISNRVLRAQIFFSSIIGTATLTMAWFVQPYFNFVQLPLSLYGLFWTLLNLTVGLTAVIAYRIERRMGRFRMVPAIAVLVPAGYLVLGQVQGLWTISLLFLFYAIRGIATPVLKDYIHRHTSSEVRATVLSLRNFITRLMFIIMGPLMGQITDNSGLQKALNAGGMIFLVLAAALAILSVRSYRNA